MSDNPYELWDTHRSLGVMKAVKPETEYFLPMFTGQINSTDEYIDFEKIPLETRTIAPLVMPLARGKPVWSASATANRFKPAYVKVEEEIDPLQPLVKMAGVDNSMLEANPRMTPMERLAVLKAVKTAAAVRAIRRRWEWMAAMAVRDGAVTLVGENYPSTVVNFGRATGHTITLGVGERLGDSGVSTIDFIQETMDMIFDAEFGGMVTRITVGKDVAAYLRTDTEFMDHMDLTKRGGNITVERGLVSSGKVYKLGEMMVGGESGARVEIWVNNETYKDPITGTTTRFVGAKQMLFTCSPEDLKGFQCFGRIIDRKANYEPVPIFPSNWVKPGDPEVEYLTWKSAPLMVPGMPDTTAVANVLAP